MVSLFYFGPLKVKEEKKEVDGKSVIVKTSIADQQAKQPESLRNPYNFLVQLFILMREQNKMSNDQKAVHNAYLENRSKFQWPRDDREAHSVLTDFFSQASFIKRIELHQKHINKSKTRMSSLFTLYYIELSDNNRMMNMVSFGDTGYEILKSHQSKDKKVSEQVTKEEKKEKRKPDQERLSKLAKPKDKWKVGKKLVELQKMFPHDRVLERMIAEEFSKN